MRVAVSGASGLIGSALVPAFRRAGHDVVRLVRREASAPDEVAWDPAAGRLDPGALAGVEALVNLSGENLGQRWTDARKAEILRSRLEATGLLARTAAALELRPALVCASAVGYYGDRGSEILTEESAAGTGFLANVARAWEDAADPAREAGLRVVHFRQGIVLSTHGGALQRMLLPFKLGVGGRVGSGDQWWSWIGVEDLAHAYTLALTGDLDGAFNLTTPDPVTNEQFTKALGRALHRPTIFPVPGFALRALFGEMGETMLLEGQRVLPARLGDAGFEFAAPTIDVALERVFSD